MDHYPLFVVVAALAILSPGPGVVMTLSNAARSGFCRTLPGILGIACGAWIVAGAAVTGLGLVLTTSTLAFTILKFAGAAYLVYLGWRLWRAPPMALESPARAAGPGRRFLEGLSLQVTNPKAVFFFLSVFPQFLNPGQVQWSAFAVLVFTYALLIVVIHSAYAVLAGRARNWLASAHGGQLLQRAGGAAFVFFGAMLATAKR